MKNFLVWAWIALVPAAVAPAGAGGFDALKAQVKEYTLSNGLTFLVLERHDAPVFSFVTFVDAGGVDEVPGITGVAHMFEHMAFKGTPTVGSKDYPAEVEAMKRVDAAVAALTAEQNKGAGADSTKLKELEAALKAEEKKSQELLVSNEFSKILDENGVVDINAETFTDWTQYYYSLPSNRFELWARMEGDRLTNPVLREYYTERDVVYEERRMQESSPTGRLLLDWIGAAFTAHPYGIGGVIGISSDLKRITREDAWAFFHKYYVGSNITIAVIGDVTFEQVKEMADKYFSGVQAGADPPPLRTVEPRHDAEIRVMREEDAQPFILVGFHVPAGGDPRYMAVDVLGDVVGSGRTSRLYKRLVKEDKIAAQAGGGTGFLGDKYPNLLVLQAVVAKDATTDTVEAAMYEELAEISKDGPTAEEVQKIKTRAKAAFVRLLRSNSGLASQLAMYEEKWGSWEGLFDYLDRLEAVTPADVQQAAQEAFRPGNRVVGILQKPRTQPSASADR